MQACPAKATISFLPTGPFPSSVTLYSNTSLTYLTFSFIGCTVMKKLCHQTFQCPEGGFFRCLTKKFEEKKNQYILSLVLLFPSSSQVTVNSNSNFLPENTLVQLSSNIWHKARKTEGNFPTGLKPKVLVYSCYCAIDFQLFRLLKKERTNQNLILETYWKQINSPWPQLNRQNEDIQGKD